MRACVQVRDKLMATEQTIEQKEEMIARLQAAVETERKRAYQGLARERLESVNAHCVNSAGGSDRDSQTMSHISAQ